MWKSASKKYKLKRKSSWIKACSPSFVVVAFLCILQGICRLDIDLLGFTTFTFQDIHNTILFQYVSNIWNKGKNTQNVLVFLYMFHNCLTILICLLNYFFRKTCTIILARFPPTLQYNIRSILVHFIL